MMTQVGLEQESFKTLMEKLRTEGSFSDALERMRQRAWQLYVNLGLPSRRSEAFRTIKLRQLFARPYQLSSALTLEHEQIAEWIQPECRESCLVFVNGSFIPHLSRREAIPSGVVTSSLQEAAQTFGAFLNNQWAKSFKEEADPFAALNGALHQSGLFLYIPPKCHIQVPIQILHIIDGNVELSMHIPRIQIMVGAHAEASFLAAKHTRGGSASFVNQVAELSLEDGAQVTYTQMLCDEHPQGWHFDALRAYLKRDSKLKTICVTEGSATVRTDYRISLMGENAEALLNGVWMLADKREAHCHIFIDHQSPNCRSYQLFKGVLNDFSRSSFEGKIMVRQDAQKTEAFQLNNNLI